MLVRQCDYYCDECEKACDSHDSLYWCTTKTCHQYRNTQKIRHHCNNCEMWADTQIEKVSNSTPEPYKQKPKTHNYPITNKENRMSEKTRINLWKSESKAGNVYLSGSDKDAGLKYMIFMDKKDPNVRNVVTRPLAATNAKLNNVEDLTVTESDKVGTFYGGETMALFPNSFYYDNEEDAAKGGIRFLTRKDGSEVLNSKGEPIEKPSHVLMIK